LAVSPTPKPKRAHCGGRGCRRRWGWAEESGLAGVEAWEVGPEVGGEFMDEAGGTMALIAGEEFLSVEGEGAEAFAGELIEDVVALQSGIVVMKELTEFRGMKAFIGLAQSVLAGRRAVEDFSPAGPAILPAASRFEAVTAPLAEAEHQEGREETAGRGEARDPPVIAQAAPLVGEMVNLLQLAAEPAA